MQIKVEQLQSFLEQFKAQVMQETEKLWDAPIPQITKSLFEQFEQNGNRVQFEEVYFTRRKMLAFWGLRAFIEKQETNRAEERTMQKLIAIIEDICREECWALAAHVNRKNDNWRITVDLFAAETAQTLSELADRLRAELPVEIYDKIVENIERRILQPFFSSEVGQCAGENANHNWNAVVMGSIGSVSLHLLREDKERLEKSVARVCKSLPYFIDGYAEDGACMEGLGYFTYGMTYFTNFAQELYEYTEGKIDLLRGDWAGFRAKEEDKRARIAEFWTKCYFNDGRTISFSDGNSHDCFRMGLGLLLSRRFSINRMPDVHYAANILHDSEFRFAGLKMDLFETSKYIECKTEKKNIEDKNVKEQSNVFFHVLPDAQWCIASSENGIGMACKGGNNGEPHNHNDVGNFLYESRGILFFTDLGAGEYTRDYFNEKRYHILCTNSFGHSVPIIDGCGQHEGQEYGCSEFVTRRTKEQGMIRIELSEAYESKTLKTYVRECSFDFKNGDLYVSDRFEMSQEDGSQVIENLVTQIEPEVQKNQVLLKKNGVTACLTRIGLSKESDIIVKKYEHSNHKAQMETLYAIQWEVPFVGTNGSSNYHIMISTSNEEKEKEKYDV